MNAPYTPISVLRKPDGTAIGGSAAMREPLEKARHLPGRVYCDPGILALEHERIFKTHWLCVGREEEVAKPGDYLAMRIADQPIIVSRASADEIVVLRNRCLHRGVEVAFGAGSAENFICPYHAWSYDRSGKLTGAGYMKGSQADLSNCSLPRVRSARWRGWIFVNFGEAAQPFEEFIAPYEKPLWFYQSGKARLADKLVVEVNTNWKFVVENLLDMYHVSTLHAKTFGKFLKLLRDELPFDALPGGGLAFNFGSKPMTADGSQSFAILSWLRDQDLGFAGKGNIFPNMNLSIRADSMRMWVLWPITPERTQIISYLLVDESAFDAPEFAERLATYREYLRSIVAEDQSALESLQRNARAADFEPGPLSHLEGPIHHVLNHYLDVIGG
jgi:phenylpropionate dioxygenase-like ring-hydroxylating dioxygenase large terminal subunit